MLLSTTQALAAAALVASLFFYPAQGTDHVAVALGAPLLLLPTQQGCAVDAMSWLPAPSMSRGLASASSLVIFFVELGDAGVYSARSTCSSNGSDVLRWHVDVIAATLVDQGEKIINVGSSLEVVLSLKAAAPLCSWLRRGQALSANSSAVRGVDAGAYVCIAADASSGGVAASAAVQVSLAASAPVALGLSIGDERALYIGGSAALATAGTRVLVVAFIDGVPFPNMLWMVDSEPQQPADVEDAAAPPRLSVQVPAQAGQARNITLLLVNALGTASLTVSLVAARSPLLERVPGAPVALVVGAGVCVNVSAQAVLGRSPVLFYAWSWGEPASTILTPGPWTLLCSGPGGQAGTVSCVAHSAAGASPPLDVMYLIATLPPVLLTSPPPFPRVVSGLTLRLAASASGSGNSFVWRHSTVGASQNSSSPASLLSLVSPTVVYEELRAPASFVSTELSLSAVSMADASAGVELLVSNPGGSAPMQFVDFVVLAPPWALHCAPLTASYLAPVLAGGGVVIARAYPVVDSAACGRAWDASHSPECFASVTVVWSARMECRSGGAGTCPPWTVSGNASIGSFRLPMSAGITRGAPTAQVYLLAAGCPLNSTFNDACVLVVDMAASVGAPYDAGGGSASECSIRSSALPLPAAALARAPTASHLPVPVRLVPASATPFPGWALLPPAAGRLPSGTPSATGSPSASVLDLAMHTPLALASLTSSSSAFASVAASGTPSASATPSQSATCTFKLSPDVAVVSSSFDALLAAALSGAAIGVVVALGADVACSGKRVGLPVNLIDVITWLQFGVVLDLLVLPEHSSFLRLTSILPLVSGILPFGSVAVPDSVKHDSVDLVPATAVVGFERFAGHLHIHPETLPVAALVSLAFWWVFAAASTLVLAIASSVAMRAASHGELVISGKQLRRLPQVSWPTVFRVGMSLQRTATLLLLPVILASGLYASIWVTDGVHGAAVISGGIAVALGVICGMYELTTSVVSAARIKAITFLLIVLCPAAALGAWPSAPNGPHWLIQCVALISLYALSGLVLVGARVSQRVSAARRKIDVLTLHAFIRCSILSCLCADAASVLASGGVSESAGHVETYPGTFAAVAIFCACGSATAAQALARVVHLRVDSVTAAAALACDERVVPDRCSVGAAPCAGLAAARRLGLDASFLGGRHALDVSGAVCFWALVSGVITLDFVEPVPEPTQRSSRAVVFVGGSTPPSLPVAGGAGQSSIPVSNADSLQTTLRTRPFVLDPLEDMGYGWRDATASVDSESRVAPVPTKTAVTGRSLHGFLVGGANAELPQSSSHCSTQPIVLVLGSRSTRGDVSVVLPALRYNVRAVPSLLSSECELAALGTVSPEHAGRIQQLGTDPAAPRTEFSPTRPRGFASRVASVLSRRRVEVADAFDSAVLAGVRRQRNSSSELQQEDFSALNPMHLGSPDARGGRSLQDRGRAAWVAKSLAFLPTDSNNSDRRLVTLSTGTALQRSAADSYVTGSERGSGERRASMIQVPSERIVAISPAALHVARSESQPGRPTLHHPGLRAVVTDSLGSRSVPHHAALTHPWTVRSSPVVRKSQLLGMHSSDAKAIRSNGKSPHYAFRRGFLPVMPPPRVVSLPLPVAGHPLATPAISSGPLALAVAQIPVPEDDSKSDKPTTAHARVTRAVPSPSLHYQQDAHRWQRDLPLPTGRASVTQEVVHTPIQTPLAGRT